MNAHTQIAAYTDTQLDAFPVAATWQQSKAARAELSKLDAAIAAYKATFGDSEWDALCDAQTAIVPALETIREETIFDLCSDSDHYDALEEDAIYGDEAAQNYVDGVIFGEADLRSAAQ